MPRAPRLSTAAGTVRASVFAELQRHIDAYQARGGRIIPLQIGDACWEPPPEARLAQASGGVDDPELYRYGPVAGAPALLEAIGRHVRPRFDWIEPKRHVVVGCGATHALFCAARAVLDPGDDVLVAAPYWPLVPGILHSCGARPVEVPLTSRLYAEEGLDAGDVLREAITDRTSAIYLITPNNPDGKVLGPGDLASIAALARERDLWVFADEVYSDFAFAEAHASIGALPGMAERTVTAHSFSKSHALAGARVGFVLAPEAVALAARRVSNHTIYNTPLFAQRAAAAALGSPPEWSLDIARRARAARDAAVQAMSGTGLSIQVPDGGAYLFVDFSPVLDQRPLLGLLERAIDHGVLVAPGEAFGAGYDAWARICYTGVETDELLEGLARLRVAIEEFAR